MAQGCNSIIESLGVYLPEKAVSTEEILAGCKSEVRFPLEEFTGIASRRMAGPDEFSIDLARNAVAECLEKSRHAAEDVDLIVASNISRFDAPRRVTYEPSTSMTLKRHFGLRNALAFDITNACAGMFTAVYLVDALIKMGTVRCGLVVSGEYITHLTDTAQEDIDGYMDPHLACLTLGDAGAAVILEPAPSDDVGFHEIELYTVAKYSPLCVAKPSAKQHGGATMATDAVQATAAALEHTPVHAADLLRRSRRPLESFHHVIPHQTSKTSITEGLSEIALLFGKNVKGMVVNNLAERGNTASNTHFVALKDQILNNTIKAGDSVVFCFSGSGMTVGTALYTLDDLPDRLWGAGFEDDEPAEAPARRTVVPVRLDQPPRVRIEAVGSTSQWDDMIEPDTRELIRLAGELCLERSSHHRSDVDLLMSVGVYRTDFIAEPAIAAMAAADLKINENSGPVDERQTIAFDVPNGSCGFLNACHLAASMIKVKKHRHAMIVASEIENNADIPSAERRCVKQVGSAVILEESADGQSGFGRFVFKDFPEYLDSFACYAEQVDGRTRLVFERSPKLEDQYLKCIHRTVQELLDAEGLEISKIHWVFPPQISPSFVSRLGDVLEIDRPRIVDISREAEDWFTSSTACALQHARDGDMIADGDVGLLINVGTGIQVGCAIYYF